MTPQRIRQVKREIRVLGVAAARRGEGYSVVGVVYRGSRWLDGVMRGSSSDLTTAIVDMLAASPHEGQVRVILLSRGNLPPGVTLSPYELYEKTGKPAIMIDGEDHLSAGLGRWTAEAVLKASTREGANPEALRVASMTLSALVAAEDA